LDSNYEEKADVQMGISVCFAKGTAIPEWGSCDVRQHVLSPYQEDELMQDHTKGLKDLQESL